MANHASHAALPYPVKNARYTVAIGYLDADGDPTDPVTPDTEISKDGGAFADCAEEVTVITGSNGTAWLTLTGAEMDCSFFSLAAKVASGPKASLIPDGRPRVLPVLFSGTASAGAAGSLTLATSVPAVADLLIGCILKTTGGTGGGGAGGLNNQARVITGYTTGRVASVTPNWETTPDGTTTYEVLLTETAYAALANLVLLRGSEPNVLISGRLDANAQIVADKTGYALTAAEEDAIVDKMWDEGRTAHVADGSMGQTMQIIRSATAQAGAAATITLDAGASATDDFYNDLVVQIIGGTGVGQARLIRDYTGSTKVADITPNWVTNPDATSVFLLLPATREDLGLWLGVAPLALASQRVVSDVGAINGATGGIAAVDRAWRAIVTGTVGASATTVSIPTSSLDPAVTVTDQLKGRILIFDENTTTAALRGQATDITASTTGGTLTVTALTTAPVSGDTFVIL